MVCGCAHPDSQRSEGKGKRSKSARSSLTTKILDTACKYGSQKNVTAGSRLGWWDLETDTICLPPLCCLGLSVSSFPSYRVMSRDLQQYLLQMRS